VSTRTLNQKVNEFLDQKRIAVAGVSRDPSRHPTPQLIYRKLKSTGHEVFGVNPGLQEFEGAPCYPDVMSIPGGVDGVVIVTRPAHTEEVVRQCAEAGVPRVWMHQSLPQAGTSVSTDAVEFCREHNIEVIAGACPMMYGPQADFPHRCILLFLSLTGGLPE
jgi:predicted CoA-binding protein